MKYALREARLKRRRDLRRKKQTGSGERGRECVCLCVFMCVYVCVCVIQRGLMLRLWGVFRGEKAVNCFYGLK